MASRKTEISADQDKAKGKKPATNNGGNSIGDASPLTTTAQKKTSSQGCRQKSTSSVPLLEENHHNGLTENDAPAKQRNGKVEGSLNGADHNSFWTLPEDMAYGNEQFYPGTDILSPHRNPAGGDDMESYFNANAHLLNHSDSKDATEETDIWPNGDFNDGYGVYESWIANDSRDTANQQDEGVGMLLSEEGDGLNGNQGNSAYLSEAYLGYLGMGAGHGRCNSNDSLYNHCEDETYQMTVANSMEDVGDFIETDIPENAYGCGSTDSNSSRSRTPSDDDLPTLSLDPASRVTGAGDIQGALRLDWNLQCNLEPAQRPPSLMVINRNNSTSTSEVPSGQKSRTASDTDYGFYTPTSCTGSGSSLRTRSAQSPQYSECSATFETTSADSSAFTSPDADHGRAVFQGLRDNRRRGFLGSPEGQSMPSNHSSDTDVSGHNQVPVTRPRSDGHLFAKIGNLEKHNFDALLRKSSQDKHVDSKLCNSDTNVHPQSSREVGEGAMMGCRDSHHHSSLPHISAKPAASGQTEASVCYNDLNPTQAAEGRSSRQSGQFNVSRQTSTSDFDQDENSFQEVVDVPPGLLNAACHSCDEFDEEDNEELTFYSEDYQPAASYSSSSKQCNCLNETSTSSSSSAKKKSSSGSLAERRQARHNLLQMASEHDDRDSLHSLLQGSRVVDSPPEEAGGDASSIEDILPLPPQTPILNRQWLKKAAKYMDYNILYKNLFKEYGSESDSEDDGVEGSDHSPTDLPLEMMEDSISPSDSMVQLRGRKMLYSVLLKDALLKHLQDRSSQYEGQELEDSQDVKKVMLWTEYQAYRLQVSQIGTSACGATAVINVLKYFDLYIEQERVCEVIKTNMRAECAPVVDYLFSRSVAGTTGTELIEGIRQLTDGEIVGRFFHMFPRRDINIRKWLGKWMEKGAVPVVVLNRQRAIPHGWVVPDAWHHQMVYGVGPKGLYLTNPLEIVPELVIQNQLSSESVLLIRRNDVVSRWRDTCDLGRLLTHPDVRWQAMNVLGQVINVLREESIPRMGTQCPQLTSHITIPAWYKSGVVLFVRRNSQAHQDLAELPNELPLRGSRDTTGTTSSAGSTLQRLFAEEDDKQNSPDSPDQMAVGEQTDRVVVGADEADTTITEDSASVRQASIDRTGSLDTAEVVMREQSENLSSPQELPRELSSPDTDSTAS